jgi:hypothetical protein
MSLCNSTAPYQPGQAIYLIGKHGVGNDAPPELYPAIVLRTTEKRVRILLASGRESSVAPHSICWRAWCEACALPAVDAEHPICPACGRAATEGIPPDRVLFDQIGELPPMARWVRNYLAGARWADAHPVRAEIKNDPFEAMLKRTGLYHSWSIEWRYDQDTEKITARGHWDRLDRVRLGDLARLGDDAAFVAEYRRQVAALGLEDEIAKDAEYREWLREFTAMIHEMADNEPPPSRRAVVIELPPIERPADDSEPSGADDVTRWLDDQFGRAA